MGTNTEVHVVGAGLGGLTTAALAARAGHSVTVHESRRRLGGRATTDEKEGFRFNQGPHALYLSGEAYRILGELGIRPRGKSPAVSKTRVLAHGEVHRAVVGPWSLVRTGLLSVRDKLDAARFLTRLAKLDAASYASITTAAMIAELTDREPVQKLLHTLIRLSTYVNAPDHLSADVAVLQLQYAASEGVIYLDRGWEQLVDALTEVAISNGVTFERDHRLTELPDAPAVIVAVGGPEATAKLTGHPFPSGIEASVSSLDLGLSAPPRHPVLLGIDQPMYLSDHGFPDEMAPPGCSNVSVAQYLAPEAEPDREALAGFASEAGIAKDTILTARYLHRMSAVSAIPTAETGGLAGRPSVQVSGRPGVFVAGDWVGGRGHLADAVLASAEEAAMSAIAHLAQRPAVL